MFVAAGSLIFLFLIVGIIPLIIHIMVSIWAYRDALRNGNSKEFALLVLLGILFFPIMGLIIYLLIRRN